MSQEVYAITNLEGYASQLRAAAAKTLTEDVDSNLDEFISLGQILNMVNQECVGYDDEDRPLLDEDANEKIFHDTAIWIENVGLAKLAAKDLVECAWDSESNEMIFWIKENKKVNNGKRKSRKQNKQSEG